MQQHNSKINLQ